MREFARGGEGSNVYQPLNAMLLEQLSELPGAAGGVADGEDVHSQIIGGVTR